jgi:hypothetical protein
MLHINTPFSKAVLLMFNNLDAWLANNYNNLPTGAVKVYIFGGCAIHLHTGARTSNDLDAEIEAIKRLQRADVIIQAVNFEDEDGLPSILEFDRNFNTTFAPIHPDYKERARLLTTDFRLVHLYLISAVDIAVSLIR